MFREQAISHYSPNFERYLHCQHILSATILLKNALLLHIDYRVIW